MVVLDPEHFTGKPATIAAADDAPAPHGTLTEFKANEDRDSLFRIIAEAARYFPLDVRVNGTKLVQSDFLEGAAHVERWKGVRIGVMHWKGSAPWAWGRINFHGHLFECETLPKVSTLAESPELQDNRETWSTRVDVVDRNDLELVLPARKEAVVNDYLQELARASERAIFRAIKSMADQAGRAPLSHETWSRAIALGVNLPMPKAQLCPWTAQRGDEEGYERSTGEQKWSSVPDDEIMLMEVTAKAPDQQALARALKRNGLLDRVYTFDERLEGYPWFRKLSRIKDMKWWIEQNGKRISLDQVRSSFGSETAPEGRVTRIEVVLTIENSDGSESTESLRTDLAFRSNEAGAVEEIDPILTVDSRLSGNELGDLMCDGYFHPIWDENNRSVNAQRATYRRSCREEARALTDSIERARFATLREIAQTYLLQEIRENEDVTIRVRPGRRLSLAVTGAGCANGGRELHLRIQPTASARGAGSISREGEVTSVSKSS